MYAPILSVLSLHFHLELGTGNNSELKLHSNWNFRLRSMRKKRSNALFEWKYSNWRNAWTNEMALYAQTKCHLTRQIQVNKSYVTVFVAMATDYFPTQQNVFAHLAQTVAFSHRHSFQKHWKTLQETFSKEKQFILKMSRQKTFGRLSCLRWWLFSQQRFFFSFVTPMFRFLFWRILLFFPVFFLSSSLFSFLFVSLLFRQRSMSRIPFDLYII